MTKLRRTVPALSVSDSPVCANDSQSSPRRAGWGRLGIGVGLTFEVSTRSGSETTLDFLMTSQTRPRPRTSTSYLIPPSDPDRPDLTLESAGASCRALPYLAQNIVRLRPRSWVTGGFLSLFGGGSYRIRILMYLDVSCMYLDCILMCPVHIHQDTSRYIKIHLYLSLCPSFDVLPMDMYVSFFTIHLRYN